MLVSHFCDVCQIMWIWRLLSPYMNYLMNMISRSKFFVYLTMHSLKFVSFFVVSVLGSLISKSALLVGHICDVVQIMWIWRLLSSHMNYVMNMISRSKFFCLLLCMHCLKFVSFSGCVSTWKFNFDICDDSWSNYVNLAIIKFAHELWRIW